MKFTIICSLLLLPILTLSQVTVGIRSGMAFSKQKYDNFCHSPCTSNHIIGMEIGAMLNWFFLNDLFLQPEFSFVQKGGTYISHVKDINKINHIETAILAGYEKKSEQLSIFVNSGLFLDRVLKILKYEGGPFSPYHPDEIKDNKWGWGFIHSGGVAIPINNGQIGIEGRYRYSLNEYRRIYELSIDGERSPNSVLNYKNKGWSINLTYKATIQ